MSMKEIKQWCRAKQRKQNLREYQPFAHGGKEITANKRSKGDTIMKIYRTQDMTLEEKYTDVSYRVTYIALLACMLLAAAAISMTIGVIGQAVDGAAAQEIWTSSLIVYNMLMLSVECFFVSKVFGKLRISDSPFREEIVNGLRRATNALVGGGIGGVVLYLIFELTVETLPNKTFYGSSGNFYVYILLGLIMKAITLIFEYGCKLQQESDETL